MLKFSKSLCGWFGVADALLLASLLAPARLVAQAKPTAGTATTTFRVAGTVVNSNTAQPLARVQISLTNTKDPKDTRDMTTAADGHFQFQVKPGKYSLQGSKHGFVTFAYEQHENFWTAIVPGAGVDTENLIFRLPPAATITGRVVDDVGDPVRGAAVTVFREDHSTGASHIQRAFNAVTDDQGTYELTPLAAGTYYVGAQAQPWYAVHPLTSQAVAAQYQVDRNLDVAFPMSFYKEATEADDATPIPIRAGDRAQVDLPMTPVPALHLLIHARPDSPRGMVQPNLQKPLFDGNSEPVNALAELVSPGSYEMTGIAAGKYLVQSRNTENGIVKDAGEVFLNADGQVLDSSGGAATGSVRIAAQVRGLTKLPDQLLLALRNTQGRVLPGVEVNDHGEADFAAIAPGKYDIVAGSPAKIYSILRITSEGKTLSGHTITITSGASLKVSAALVGGAVTVEGFAKKQGKPAPVAMIVLVPSDPEVNLDLFRRDQSDLDGSFALQQVIPGTYTILAIEDGWDLDWAKPAVIESYRQHGQKIVIGDTAKGFVRLSSAVEVQPRL